jgi:hypothetical protein
MTAATVPFAAPATRAPSLRLLGTIGILASPMLLAEVPLMRLADGDAQRDVVMGLCSLVYVAGFAASAVGLRILRATGDGRGARLAFGVQMLGLALAALWAAQYVAAPASRGPRSCASPMPHGRSATSSCWWWAGWCCARGGSAGGGASRRCSAGSRCH